MSKKLVLLFVLIALITTGAYPAKMGITGKWELTHTITDIQYACGVYAHPSGEFIIVNGRGSLLMQLSTDDYSVLRTLQLPTATDCDSLAWGTPFADHSLVFFPDEHGSVFIVDPLDLSLKITLPQSWYYGTGRMVVTSDGTTAIGSHSHYSYPGWLYFYDLTKDPIQTSINYIAGQPGGIVLSPDERYLFVASCCTGVTPQIKQIDLQTRSEVDFVDFSGVVTELFSSLSIDPLNRKIFSGTPQGLLVIDIDTLAYELYDIGTVGRVTFDTVHRRMVATGGNQFLVLDPETYEVTQRFTLGSTSLCVPEFSIDGTKVFLGDVVNSVMHVFEYTPGNQPPTVGPGGPH